mmetsp:Transcript_897/g.2132  ORF Transcript_897/g.2132 Transcript_897/m.2132 type:complete len:248 (-) Transcript_897:492-1235(-)
MPPAWRNCASTTRCCSTWRSSAWRAGAVPASRRRCSPPGPTSSGPRSHETLPVSARRAPRHYSRRRPLRLRARSRPSPTSFTQHHHGPRTAHPPRHVRLATAGLDLLRPERDALRLGPGLVARGRPGPRLHGDGLCVLPVHRVRAGQVHPRQPGPPRRHADVASRRLERFRAGHGPDGLGPVPHGDPAGVEGLPRRLLALPDLQRLHAGQDAARRPRGGPDRGADGGPPRGAGRRPACRPRLNPELP